MQKCLSTIFLLCFLSYPLSLHADLYAKDLKPQKELPKTISLELQRMNVKHVLTFLAELHGLNIVFTRAVNGRITAYMREVDPTQALEVILGTQGLYARQEGNILIVDRLL